LENVPEFAQGTGMATYTANTVVPFGGVTAKSVRLTVNAAYGTTTFTINPGTYKSVTVPIKTIGDYTCIVIRKDLPDSLVYELNKALWANRDSLAMAVGDIAELNPKEALPAGLPSHAGSVQFWKSVK